MTASRSDRVAAVRGHRLPEVPASSRYRVANGGGAAEPGGGAAEPGGGAPQPVGPTGPPVTTVAPARPLTAEEVLAGRRRHGSNALPEPKPYGVLRRVGTQLRDPLVLVLLAAMLVTAALRDVPDLVVIGMVIVLNTTVGVVQEVRADRAVAALRRLAAPFARVVRADGERIVPAADLVPDDVVRLGAGDVVAADIRLVEAVRLTVDEAALTGESTTVAKAAGSADPALGEVAAGTVIATGRAVGVVVRTGSASALGRIAALVAAQPRRLTPLQRRLVGLGRVLALAAVALSTVVLVVGLAHGLSLARMVLAAVSLTVAAVPESLPAVVTVALALGARRMARRSAIVRRLPAVETLGSVTVVAADKTGTLTEGVMSVDRMIGADGSTARPRGEGYDPRGQVTPDPLPPALTRLVRDMLLCNDADLVPPGGHQDRWTPLGDPMEAALVAAAMRAGADPGCRSAYPRLAERPFDAVRRRMTTLHRTPAGEYLVVCKGAPEVLLAPDGPLVDDPAVLAGAVRLTHELASEGFRVLAIADAVGPARPDRLEVPLRLAGLVALADPLRRGATEVVERFRSAGIRLVLITGDHPATAAAVANRLSIVDDVVTEVVLGEHLDSGSGWPSDAAVFARTRPEHKLVIVDALQSAGAVVAMTGDGVNDAPALRRADIGVAMGRGGTEAARQAADLVLADDNLATVAVAVEEGRRIYANIRRFLGYALSGGLAEVVVMLVGPWVGLLVPLLPAQILWVNMLTHGLPGVALGAEPAEPNVMRRRPRRPDEAILGGGLGRRVLGTGALIAVVALSAALVAYAADRPWQSVLFTVLGLAQLGLALAMRSRGPLRKVNWYLDAAVALSVALQLAALWWGPLRSLLGTQPLTLAEVGACAAVAAIPGLTTVLAGLVRQRRPARRARRPGEQARRPGERARGGPVASDRLP